MWNIGWLTLTGCFININCTSLLAMRLFIWKVLSRTIKCEWFVLMCPVWEGTMCNAFPCFLNDLGEIRHMRSLCIGVDDFFLVWRDSPPLGQGFLIHEISRSYTTT